MYKVLDCLQSFEVTREPRQTINNFFFDHTNDQLLKRCLYIKTPNTLSIQLLLPNIFNIRCFFFLSLYITVQCWKGKT